MENIPILISTNEREIQRKSVRVREREREREREGERERDSMWEMKSERKVI